MIRGFGAIPDRYGDVQEDLRVRHVGQLVGAAPVALPDGVDYSSMLGEVPDQGASSSCVGQAFATALYLRSRIAGTPIERPSAKAIYDLARLSDTPGRLSDGGSRPTAALEAIRKYGLVAESRWPLTPDNVDELPPLDVFQHGLGALLSQHYRIGGGDVALLARQALAKGFPVFFAMPVDEAFVRLAGTTYDGAKGPILGNHAMVLCGFDVGSFLVANSWGPEWGVGGVGRIADRVLEDHAFDLIVPTLIPEAVT